MTDNVTTLPTRPAEPARPTYFEQAEGEPHIDHLIFALDGVCSALDAEQISFDDDDQINRISNLSCAARILARQLQDRMTSKPPTKRELEATRKAHADWAAVRQQAGDAQLN